MTRVRLLVCALLLAAWSCVCATAPIDTARGVHQARQRALDEVFGGRIPTTLPSDVVPVPPPHGARMGVYLVGARSFYLVPKKPVGKLAIYHAGHRHGGDEQRPLIAGAEPVRRLLAAGYHVLAIRMVPTWHTPEVQGSLRPFLEPVAVALNYAMAQRQFSDVVMFGLSGGGWTTAVYAALDTRITRSVPIAGTWPDELRRADPKSLGDWEQQLPGLSLDYPTLYVLAASAGRSSVQVFNSHDPCCFAGDGALGYRDAIARQAAGRFDVVIADNHQHTVPREAMALVLD